MGTLHKPTSHSSITAGCRGVYTARLFSPQAEDQGSISPNALPFQHKTKQQIFHLHCCISLLKKLYNLLHIASGLLSHACRARV